MKFNSLRAVALALVAIHLTTVNSTQAQGQTATTAPATGDSGLPPGIAQGSQTAEVLKLAQAGLDPSVINSYIANAPSAFNLDADQIVTLKDAGLPSASINAMMDHDRSILATTTTASTAPAPVPAPTTDTTPPPDSTPPPPDTSAMPPPDVSQDTTDNGPDTAPPPVSIDYFNQTLDGYGNWVMVPGYGRCWRPTTVLFNPNWHPYCDEGRWVYTDCGWYWQSDYAWGATFHYGRWFRDSFFGWCWYPDYVWAPSWVVWRSSDDYCGWAPLPPLTIYQPGVGLLCRGTVVSVDFDFGFSSDVFIFVDHDHFCDRHPRDFCLDRRHGDDAFRHTTIINNFDVHNTVVVNNGISVEKVRPHNMGVKDFHPVPVGSLAYARREGWRGQVTVPQHTGPGNPGHDTHRTGGQPQGGANFNGNNGGSHTFNNNANNNQGVTHFNNPGGNSGNSLGAGNNRDFHGGNQVNGNSGTHFNPGSGQSTVTTTTTANNNSQNNHVMNQNPNGNNTFNNNFNQGGAHTGNPMVNNNNNNFQNNHVANQNPNGNHQNNQNNQVVNQGPGTGNGSSARYSSPATTPAAPPFHNPTPPNNYNNNGNSAYNNRPEQPVPPAPGSGFTGQRSQPQYQAPQNSYQPRDNNNYSAPPERNYSQPRTEPTPEAPQPQPRPSAPANTAPAYSSHNSGQSSSGGQQRNSGNNNNNNGQQQGH